MKLCKEVEALRFSIMDRLALDYAHSLYGESIWPGFAELSSLERIPIKTLRGLVRDMASEGLMSYGPLLNLGDYTPAGSGYIITREGLALYESMRKERCDEDNAPTPR